MTLCYWLTVILSESQLLLRMMLKSARYRKVELMQRGDRGSVARWLQKPARVVTGWLQNRLQNRLRVVTLVCKVGLCL